MSILNRIDEMLNETGIRNMKELAKTHKKAEIYFHIDLDGVTSAIGIRAYLKRYGIKTVNAYPIQYGGMEYAVPKPTDKTLHVLVDFAHAKPVMNIHTDHHDSQTPTAKGTSTSFVKSPSNLAYISQVLSPSDLFPPQDAKIISTVDSADFGSQGITPDDVMRSAFKVDKKIDVSKNHRAMGFVTNRLLLSYKNKKDFLKKIVLTTNPSLMSLYNNMKKLAEKEGYKPPEEITAGLKDYVRVQGTKKMKDGKISDVKSLKSGHSILIGTTIVQYGGGSMFKGYDRYTPFKLTPEAHYLTIAWPMGLLQVSKNPFRSGKNPHHLGNLIEKEVLSKFKSKLKGLDITLDTVKYFFEKDIKDGVDALGFTFNDLMALFEKEIKGLGKGNWKSLVADITNRPYKRLSKKQKAIMQKVTISAWDLMMAQSGGHPDITNVVMPFIKKTQYNGGVVGLLHDMQTQVAKVMQDKKLKE